MPAPLDDIEAVAMTIIFGQMKGAVWDWTSMGWRQPA
jgi:hypothetical protein